MRTMIRSLSHGRLGIVPILLLTACTTGSPVKMDQTVISPQESKIVFLEAAGKGFRETHYRVTTDNFTTNAHVGVWTRQNRRFPHARLTFAFLSPGYHYRSDFDIDGYVAKLRLGEANKINMLESGVVSNKLGRVTYRQFTAGSNNCVGLSQSWGASSGDTPAGTSTKQLFGHYCGSGSETVDPDQFAKLIAVKGEHLPESYKTTATKSDLLELPLVIRWQGFEKALSGKLTATSVNSSRGRLWLRLPDGRGDCTGEWKWLSGKYGTGTMVTGTWKALCTNGLAAEGDYQGTDRRKLSGKGKDRQGREIRFSTGTAAAEQSG